MSFNIAFPSNDFDIRCSDAQPWDDWGSEGDKLEVSFLELNVSTNFNDTNGTICFSRDGSYYSTSGFFNEGGIFKPYIGANAGFGYFNEVTLFQDPDCSGISPHLRNHL